MNKKETLEIRKQFTNENCAITRICGCYVDAEKQIRTELKEAFLSLPEEEIFKYYEIFKKTPLRTQFTRFSERSFLIQHIFNGFTVHIFFVFYPVQCII